MLERRRLCSHAMVVKRPACGAAQVEPIKAQAPTDAVELMEDVPAHRQIAAEVRWRGSAAPHLLYGT